MEIRCWIRVFDIGAFKLRIIVYALNTKLCDFFRAIEMVDYSGCLRGNEARSLNLSSLWVESLDGFQPDGCIAIRLDNPSNKNHNTALAHALVRAKEPQQCACFALWLYLLVRFQVKREAFPDLADPAWPPSWWTVPLFPGDTPGKQLTYDTHYRRAKAAHLESGLVCRKKTHRARKSGPDNAASFGYVH